nr:uncharacterized protein LOC100185169 isoform X3 [Ciona intestinalis]|eukprot:XP_026690475.1 uncharacterized protein LOC100185169 isoform X3 [Ciona intestinalis]
MSFSGCIPASLETRKNETLSERDVVLLGKAFEECVVYTWPEFCRKFLNLSRADCQNIEADNTELPTQIREMFQKWKENEQEGATIENISGILHKCVIGIKQIWWNSYRDEQDGKFLEDRKMMETYFQKLSDCPFTPEEWSKLVVKLGLSNNHMENMESRHRHNKFSQRLSLLEGWVQIKGYETATIPALQAALKDLKLRRIICEIAGLEGRNNTPHKVYEHFLEDEWDRIFSKLEEDQKRSIINSLLQSEEDPTEEREENAFQSVMSKGNAGFHNFIKVLTDNLPPATNIQSTLQHFFIDSNYANLFHMKKANILAAHFTENNNYRVVKEKLDQGTRHVLLHGMPGSGKSQLVCAYVKHFNIQHPSSIIWSIECKDHSAMDASLVSLRKAVFSSQLLSEGQHDWREVFVQLKKTGVHILLLLEDLQKGMDDWSENLQTVVDSVLNYDKSYIIGTSRNALTIRDFDLHKVNGFTLDEAVNFLMQDREASEDEDEPWAKKIAEKYSCLPLGLAPAYAYCKNLCFSYKDYYDVLLEESESPELEYANKSIIATMVLCLGKINVMRVGPSEVDLKAVFSMVAFLHHEIIPVYLFREMISKPRILYAELEHAEQQPLVPAISKANVTRALLELLNQLKNSSIVVDSGEQNLNTRYISTHEVVQLALTNMLKREGSENHHLLNALYCLSCYFQKDNRLHTQHNQLLVLLPHVTKALSLATNKFNERRADPRKLGKEEMMQHMIILRLLEVKGFACTQSDMIKEAEEALQQAHDQMLNLLCAAGGITLDSLDATVQERILEGNGPDTVIETRARVLYQFCERAVSDIPPETFDRLLHTIVLNEEDIELLTRSEEGWTPLKANTPLTSEDLEELRRHGLAKDNKKLKSVYLAEQLASILYTRGRLMFYKGFEGDKTEYIKYIKLANYVAREVKKETGIRLLHLLITETNGLLYIKLAINGKSDEEKRTDYQYAYRRYKELCESNYQYFEHGILKEDGKTSYHIMRCYKQMMTANIKQLELPEQEVQTNWFEVCELFDEIVKNHPAYGKTATEGLIVAGELYHKGGQWHKALEFYKKAMDRVKDKEQTYKKELFLATEKFTEASLEAFENNVDDKR